jgi:hypothetical protein
MHEKYADIYFVYGFYNGDVRAAVAEHQQRFYYILDFHIETSCIIHIYMFESDWTFHPTSKRTTWVCNVMTGMALPRVLFDEAYTQVYAEQPR